MVQRLDFQLPACGPSLSENGEVGARRLVALMEGLVQLAFLYGPTRKMDNPLVDTTQLRAREKIAVMVVRALCLLQHVESAG